MRCERIRDQDTLRTQDYDSTMQRTQMPPLDEISLNRSEACDGWDGWDGCDGHGVEFYGYTRLRQLNDTSTGHLRDEYGEQFSRGLGQHRVKNVGEHGVNTLGGARINTLGGVWVNIGIIRMSLGQHRHHQDEFGSTSASLGCVRSDFITGQPVAKPSRSTYSMVFG